MGMAKGGKTSGFSSQHSALCPAFLASGRAHPRLLAIERPTAHGGSGDRATSDFGGCWVAFPRPKAALEAYLSSGGGADVPEQSILPHHHDLWRAQSRPTAFPPCQ